MMSALLQLSSNKRGEDEVRTAPQLPLWGVASHRNGGAALELREASADEADDQDMD